LQNQRTTTFGAGKSLKFALFAATMLGLGGCMSSTTDQLESISTTKPQTLAAANAPVVADTTAENPPSDIASQAAQDAEMLNENPNATENAIVPGRKNVAATKTSLFSTQPVPVETADRPLTETIDPATGKPVSAAMNATQNSIYAGATAPVVTSETVPLPNAETVAQAQDMALAGLVPPDEAPLAAEINPDAAVNQPVEQVAMVNPAVIAPAVVQQAEEPKEKPARKPRTLADLFGNADDEEEEENFDSSRFGNSDRKRLSTSSIPNMRTAALPNAALPGVTTNAMFPQAQPLDQGDEDDGEPVGLMKLASLPSMTRMASNGIWTQTSEVEVSCLRPELVSMIKFVEDHYKRPVVVTSGYRDPRHNRRAGGVRHSLHTLCAAADIQVQGVSKWALADYLRSIPGRGGVGTYCHTNSVHIDVGGERDWNWRCRRSKRRA
jgi:uncharacterized protein YcbK (DUF882 family)